MMNCWGEVARRRAGREGGRAAAAGVGGEEGEEGGEEGQGQEVEGGVSFYLDEWLGCDW